MGDDLGSARTTFSRSTEGADVLANAFSDRPDSRKEPSWRASVYVAKAEKNGPVARRPFAIVFGNTFTVMSEITRILSAIEQGDPSAAEQLLPLVYDELRKLAVAKLAQEKPGQTLQATALVHEAYLRLVDADCGARWSNRGHFFAAAAEAMRRILVENARRRSRVKHGGDREREEIDASAIVAPEIDENLIALDDALDRLAMEDALSAQVVKLRYFAGLTVPQTAESLGISPRKVDFLWSFARAWLRHEIENK